MGIKWVNVISDSSIDYAWACDGAGRKGIAKAADGTYA